MPFFGGRGPSERATMNMKKVLIALAAIAATAACNCPQGLPGAADPKDFKADGIALYTLKAGDIVLQATNYGGRVVSIFTPDRNGNLTDIAVGHRTLEEYRNPVGERFLGACVGPVANRLGGAGFDVDGEHFSTPANDNKVNTLHGGFTGLDHVVWNVVSADDSTLVLNYVHPDGQEGYPGNLDITMTYALGADNSFTVTYSATTDKPTPVNISHHSFFNLRGEGCGSIEEYKLRIFADRFIPIDTLSIPTGEILPVEGTPFDFREERLIGERIDDPDCPQIAAGHGYDHNWCLNGPCGVIRPACAVYDPVSGRVIEVLTDQSGLQFYSGNFFDGSTFGKNGRPLKRRSSLVFETQKWPDSPNHPGFTDVILRPGETYTHTCIYRFRSR